MVDVFEGASQTDWSMLFLCQPNGYVVGVWYYEGERRFLIQADKSSASAKYYYDPATGAINDEWPNAETVKQVFTAAFGEQAGEGDIHEAAVRKLTDTVQQRFGITWQELNTLPVW